MGKRKLFIAYILLFCFVSFLVGLISPYPACASQTDPNGPDDNGICPTGDEMLDAPPDADNDKEEDNSDIADPVSITGGKIFIPEVDLELNGNGKKTGIAYLNFKRCFSSQSYRSGGLGRGWVTNVEMSIEETDAGATIVSESGELINFIKYGDIYIRPECGNTSLSKDGNIFTWQLQFGSKYVFEASGLSAEPGIYHIKYIEDRYGNRIDFEYREFHDNLLGGLVEKPVKMIEPATGRYIQINWQEYYNGQENIYLIESIQDSADRVVSYEYDLEFNLYKGYQASLNKVIDAEGNSQYYDFIFEETADSLVLKSFNVTDKRGNTTVYNFNKPFESAIHFPDWNWNLRVESVIDPEGGIMQFSTDETLGMTTYIDKAGNLTVYEYSRMLLDKAIYADGRSKQFFYDARRNRIKIIDENNNEWNYVYDDLNRLQKVIDPLGNSTEWIVSTEGDNYTKWSTKIDKNGNTWSREIQGGSVMSETCPLGNKVSYAYDQFGNMVSRTDARGNSSFFSYDDSGNMISKTDEQGNTWQYSYDTVGNLLSEIDPMGNTTSYQYNKLGLMLSKTFPSGDTEEFTYDANGNMIAYKDANNNITTYDYDAMNRRTAVRLPEGIDITYEYNAMGRLIAEHKPNGTWNYEYDMRNRRVKTIDPLGNETIFAYNGTPGCGGCGSGDNISSVTDALGNITRYDYDPLGRKILETGANNKSIEYEYDAVGNMIKEIDKLNHETNYTYDNANRLVAVSNHLAEKIEIFYDANGNKIQVKDPKGNSTFYQYDKNNRLINITDAIGGQTIFSYDALGNRVAINDAKGNVTQFEYNAESRLIKTVDSIGVYELYEYDSNGNMIKKINSRAQEIDFIYDGLNRLRRKTLPGNQVISYEYDEKGNLSQISDFMGIRTYAYDSLGRVISVIYPGNMNVLYEYDAVGNRQKMIYPSGTMVNYVYDNLNQVSNISFETAGALKTFTFTYDDKGRRTGLKYPNDIETFYAYDEVDRLLSIAVGEPGLPGSIESISYNYDQNSNRTQRMDSYGTHSYSYDNINQLTNVIYPEGTNQQYTFDALGNRTNFRQDTSLNTEFITSEFNQLNQLTRSESSIYGGGNIISLSGVWDDANIDSVFVNNQIAAISGNTFTINDLALNFGANEVTIDAIDYAGNSTQTSLNITLDGTASAVYNYDLDGNLITNSLKGTTWNYSWDAENRLIKAASSLGKNIEYSYYEDGMLGSKKNLSSSDTRYYIYDGIHCIAEYDGANGFIKEYIYGPQIDEVLCSIDEYSSARYYHQDALQSVAAITDSFRNKIAAYEYDVYGKIIDSTGSLENEILYTGRWLDSDTNLYYYRARWYDAEVGRFISRDPIGVAGGINLYGYVGNAVVTAVDPLGLIDCFTLAAQGMSAYKGPRSFKPGWTCHEKEQVIFDIALVLNDVVQCKRYANLKGWADLAKQVNRTSEDPVEKFAKDTFDLTVEILQNHDIMPKIPDISKYTGEFYSMERKLIGLINKAKRTYCCENRKYR